jgi:uncharacterized protein (TIGR01244 family)
MRWLKRPAFLLVCVVGMVSPAPAVERGSAPLPARPELPATSFSNAFHQPDEGLYTGGQPTAAQLQQAASEGITTVIDLRQPNEDRGFDEASTAADLGLNYVHIPVAGAAGLSAANVQALQAALTRSNGPVLLHCASGNRVGALLALLKHQQGASTEDALQFGRSAGMTSLEAQTRTLLEQDDAR